MKRCFSRFYAAALCVLCSVLCAATFSSCVRNNASNNSEASTNQASALQTDENQNAESGDAASEQSTSDEANDDTQSSYKSHYDDSWWQSEEYEAIAKDMKEKGYYIDPKYLPANFDGKLKLSIYDEANEYETSLKDELLAVYTMYWFFNDERIEKSESMMFVPKEGTLFKSSLKELFDEAIALRPDFNGSPKKFAKDVAVTSTRVQLFNRRYQLQPRGCELEVRSNHGELDLSFDCIDRLFVITGQSEDGKAKVVFALLIEST